MIELMLKDEVETLKLGAAIHCALFQEQALTFEIHLKGNLGAGKTTLTRGLIKNAGWDGVVTSPSYTLCEEYLIGDSLFLHIDLYRISGEEDVEILDLDRRVAQSKIILIEWPENLQKKRVPDLEVELDHDDNRRTARLISKNKGFLSITKAHYEKN